ncbi:hypothetical protein ACO2Q8_14755 [Larkinella sp. VNQ87]
MAAVRFGYMTSSLTTRQRKEGETSILQSKLSAHPNNMPSVPCPIPLFA